jgi:glycosyltransferase involved in cell wall biosynthesis
MINSNQNQIDFSVVIPSRNRPELLRSAIDSVLTQTHANFELVVVNDGSDGENEQA